MWSTRFRERYSWVDVTATYFLCTGCSASTQFSSVQFSSGFKTNCVVSEIVVGKH